MKFEIFFKKIHISTSSQKYLGINLTKYVQDLHDKNYKTDEKNQRRTKQSYSAFMNWKSQYYQDVSSSQFDL